RTAPTARPGAVYPSTCSRALEGCEQTVRSPPLPDGGPLPGHLGRPPPQMGRPHGGPPRHGERSGLGPSGSRDASERVPSPGPTPRSHCPRDVPRPSRSLPPPDLLLPRRRSVLSALLQSRPALRLHLRQTPHPY